MRKNLFLRLCLILVVALTAYSCRTDQFPENETFNDISKFRLTSKRISLNEAKHKAQLVPEIEKAETEIKAYSKNAQGKSVDLGNGILINTDNVIYMENGPDYHTYTFSIQRSNPLANAPVENLVLTPLPDGGYKAYLVTYNFTEAEKNTILNGGDVQVKGKSFVTLLEGTFASVMSVDNCTMQISDYYTWCSAGKHNNGEICDADVKSQHVVIMEIVCQGGNSPQPGIEGPIDGGPDGGGGSSSATPCSANGVYLQPQDPANSDCNGGVATQPIIEFNPPKTPCQKIQEIGRDSRVKDLFEGLKTKTNSDREFCEIIRNANGEIKHTALEGIPGTATIKFTIPAGVQIDGYLHSHYDNLLSVFSPWDLAALSQWYKNGHIKDIDTFVMGVIYGQNNQYMMVIDDPAKFDTFAGAFVKNGMIDDDLTEFWGRLNYGRYNIKKIDEGGVAADNELGLVKLLADSNSGLKMLRGSNNSNDWAELVVENGQIKSKPCN